MALAGAGALALAGCHRQQAVADQPRELRLRVDPPSPASLEPGTIIRVSAVPEPWGEMAWVSGTVKLFGAPVAAFKRDPGALDWHFRTMVPPMVTIPPGAYRIKAWGRTRSGEEIRGELSYEVQ